MILQHLSRLNSRKIILASASPRRLEILQNIGLQVQVEPSNFEEDLPKDGLNAGQYAELTAHHKAVEVAQRCPDAALIIAADTVVAVGDVILEKPQNEQHAMDMLMLLSDKQHDVFTGVSIVVPRASDRSEAVTRCFFEQTRVTFAELTVQEVEAYIATKEPFGKAGAYGIQGPAGMWVRHLSGDYFNVMGLPLYRLARAISELITDGTLQL